jgi:hypothetical protein
VSIGILSMAKLMLLKDNPGELEFFLKSGYWVRVDVSRQREEDG